MALGDTKSIVPRADQQGTLGTAAKSWGQLFINNPALQSEAAATIENQTVDRKALYIDADNTTVDAVAISARDVTTASALFIRADSLTGSSLGGRALTLDVNNSATTSGNSTALSIDIDKSGALGASQNTLITAVDIAIDDAATNNAAAIAIYQGVSSKIDVASDQGVIGAYGFTNQITDIDPTLAFGIHSTIEDGGVDMRCVSSANASNIFDIITGANAETTLKTTDSGGAAGHLNFDIDGDIRFYKTNNLSDFLTLAIDANGGAKFTTTDAGGVTAHMELEADGNIVLDAAGTTTIESAGLIKLDGESGVEIENGVVDQVALLIDAANTTTNVIDISATAVTTGNVIDIDCNALSGGSALNIDVDDALTTPGSKSLIKIDYDKSGVTGSGSINVVEGLNINLTDAATNHASGATIATGVNVAIDAASNQGDIRQYGYMATLSDGDVANTTGYYSNVENGGIDFKAVSSADSGDMFTIATTTHGATTLTTVDDDATAAHFEVAADGNITLGAAGSLTFGSANDSTINTRYLLLENIGSTHGSHLQIKDTNNSADEKMSITFTKDKGAAGADGDSIFGIYATADNAAQELTNFASISAAVIRAADTDEAGGLSLKVATSDGTTSALQNALLAVGHQADNDVDVTLGYGATSTTTIAGDLTVQSKLTVKKRKFSVSTSTDGNANGDAVYFGGTTSMTTGAIYHYKSDGTWELADADAAATCDGLLGVALGAASDTDGVLLRGMVTLDHDPGAIGDVLYVSTTAGDCSATAPSGTGDIVRIIGYQVSHASDGNIWFNPDNTFVEIS